MNGNYKLRITNYESTANDKDTAETEITNKL